MPLFQNLFIFMQNLTPAIDKLNYDCKTLALCNQERELGHSKV